MTAGNDDPAASPPLAKPRRRRVLRVLLALAATPVLAALALHQYVGWAAHGHVFAPADAPRRDVAVVLGASVRNGQPSPLLEDRLRAALELHRTGRVRRILCSGDGGVLDVGYDEVDVMCTWLVDHGVPVDDLLRDRHGLRTLDSVYRAGSAFGLDAGFLVVSNGFHVPRAVFLARSRGYDVDGVVAPEGRDYALDTRWSNGLREAGARLLAWFDVYVFATEPATRDA